jgi:hypothetical protein
MMPRVCRLPDWRVRLIDYVLSIERQPFAYGACDCFTFAGGAVAAMTGEVLFPQYIGAYTTRFGMLRTLLRNGHRSVLEAARQATGALGWPAIAEADAMMGDIVVLPGEPLHSLAVVWDSGVVARMLDGLALVPNGHALSTWRIPSVDTP